MNGFVSKYQNLDMEKNKILSENRKKSGIYMWTNLINGKQYIGSAVDLYNRISFYFSVSAMKNKLKKSQSHIYNALLKYGHSNFSLTILEYCDKEKCIEREDYFMSSLPHEYNILEKAGS
jgi:group I intron endonuclease